MTLYYVETGRGCGIRRARSEEQAERECLREVGTYEGVRLVREATAHDLDWVRGMGGHIPKDYGEKVTPNVESEGAARLLAQLPSTDGLAGRKDE